MKVEILTASVRDDASVSARPVEPFDGPAKHDVLPSIGRTTVPAQAKRVPRGQGSRQVLRRLCTA
jgi:hypothetical protein